MIHKEDVGKAVLERAGVKLKSTVKRSTAERNPRAFGQGEVDAKNIDLRQ